MTTDALAVSLRSSGVSLALTVLLGLPLAVVLSRTEGLSATVLRALALLPIALPPVVGGLALLVTLGRRGVLGQPLSLLGVEIGYTTLAVILAQTFTAMPYFILAMEGALRSLDSGYERVASTLGASPSRRLIRVTLPLLAPALAGGMAMAFARALGEYGATLTFAGSVPGITQTLPQTIYLLRESDPDAALALSAVLVGIAVALMAATAWVGRPQKAGHA